MQKIVQDRKLLRPIVSRVASLAFLLASGISLFSGVTMLLVLSGFRQLGIFLTVASPCLALLAHILDHDRVPKQH